MVKKTKKKKTVKKKTIKRPKVAKLEEKIDDKVETKTVPIEGEDSNDIAEEVKEDVKEKVEEKTEDKVEEIKEEIKEEPAASDYSKPAYSPARAEHHPRRGPRRHSHPGRRMRRGVPALVKIISILFFILGIVMLVGGVIFVASEITGNNIVEDKGIGDYFNLSMFDSVTGIVLIVGIVSLIVGLIFIIIGVGLNRGRNWARVLAIVFSILLIIDSLFWIKTASIVLIVVMALIALYLILSRRVRRSFR